jgi:hypothetical protein
MQEGVPDLGKVEMANRSHSRGCRGLARTARELGYRERFRYAIAERTVARIFSIAVFRFSSALLAQ